MSVNVNGIFIVLLAWVSAVGVPQAQASSGSGFSGELLFLSVSKKTSRAELAVLPKPGEEPKIIKSFAIALGKSDGDKQKEGDKKTPEGVYFTLNHIDGQKLPAKYGSYAIPLDFPNPIDQVDGKTGYGIWLHGVDNVTRIEASRVTDGCVAFYNQDIFSLSKWLKPFQGIVVISPDNEGINRKEDVLKVSHLTQEWGEAWATRDLKKYISAYHHDFSNTGKNLGAWEIYKKKVFTGYRKMDLRINDIRVITHPKYAVSIMNQDFNGDDRFISIGRKVLYWQRNELGQYKILREGFQNLRFEKVAPTRLEAALAKSPKNI